MTARKLYRFLALLCLAGYAWIGYCYHTGHIHTGVRFCLFKNITGLPCPSCGVTRSVFYLLQGAWKEALLQNPLGIPALLFLCIAPVWLLADLAARRQSLFRQYSRAEAFLKRKPAAILAILLIASNWIWNISKEL